MGTVVSWIVCPSLSVGSPVDAFIVCVRLSFVSLFRLFTSSLMDSCIVCVRLSYVSLLDCVHCHLWTVVLSASLCSFLPLCPQVVHTVTYGQLYCPFGCMSTSRTSCHFPSGLIAFHFPSGLLITSFWTYCMSLSFRISSHFPSGLTVCHFLSGCP